MRGKFTAYVKVRCFYISVIHLSFPSDFRNKLWVVIWLGQHFQTGMLVQDQQNDLLGKIMVTM